MIKHTESCQSKWSNPDELNVAEEPVQFLHTYTLGLDLTHRIVAVAQMS